jgi:hypothetical protein
MVNVFGRSLIGYRTIIVTFFIVLFLDEKNQIPIAIGARATPHPSAVADTFSRRRRKMEVIFFKAKNYPPGVR